jgi:Amt family ammonium transporter
MALVLGRRRGWPSQNMRGHNIPFVMLGAGLLWFGWFGFNAGSALAANNLAGYAWMNTNTATATAMLGWLIVEKVRYGKPTALGAASGAVSGLVAITPCAGFVSVSGALIIGLLAGIGCAFAISLKNRLGYDDSLDVVGVHFVGGWIGTLSVGFFSTDVTNPLANNGILYGGGGKYGGWNLLLHQAEAAAVVTVFSFAGTYLIAKVIGLVMKTRVTEEEEITGLDQSIHGETAYDFGTLTGSGGGQYAPAAAASRERVQA